MVLFFVSSCRIVAMSPCRQIKETKIVALSQCRNMKNPFCCFVRPHQSKFG